MQANEVNREEEIRQLAYKLWEEAGRPDGYADNYWLEAESLWLDQQRRQDDSIKPKASRSRKSSRKDLTKREL